MCMRGMSGLGDNADANMLAVDDEEEESELAGDSEGEEAESELEIDSEVEEAKSGQEGGGEVQLGEMKDEEVREKFGELVAQGTRVALTTAADMIRDMLQRKDAYETRSYASKDEFFADLSSGPLRPDDVEALFDAGVNMRLSHAKFAACKYLLNTKTDDCIGPLLFEKERWQRIWRRYATTKPQLIKLGVGHWHLDNGLLAMLMRYKLRVGISFEQDEIEVLSRCAMQGPQESTTLRLADVVEQQAEPRLRYTTPLAESLLAAASYSNPQKCLPIMRAYLAALDERRTAGESQQALAGEIRYTVAPYVRGLVSLGREKDLLNLAKQLVQTYGLEEKAVLSAFKRAVKWKQSVRSNGLPRQKRFANKVAAWLRRAALAAGFQRVPTLYTPQLWVHATTENVEAFDRILDEMYTERVPLDLAAFLPWIRTVRFRPPADRVPCLRHIVKLADVYGITRYHILWMRVLQEVNMPFLLPAAIDFAQQFADADTGSPPFADKDNMPRTDIVRTLNEVLRNEADPERILRQLYDADKLAVFSMRRKEKAVHLCEIDVRGLHPDVAAALLSLALDLLKEDYDDALMRHNEHAQIKDGTPIPPHVTLPLRVNLGTMVPHEVQTMNRALGGIAGTADAPNGTNPTIVSKNGRRIIYWNLPSTDLATLLGREKPTETTYTV